MIDRGHCLPIVRQAELLGISRGSVYYLPQPVSAADLALMRRIDELHLEHPFLGARMLRDMLNREGAAVGRKHVSTLMRRMGIEPLYRKPNTSKKHPDHAVYPYLLRGVKVERANQVWAMDITYIPMARGFVYLCAVVDWAARCWRTACRSRWTQIFACRRSKRRWPSTAHRRSSTPTRAASSPAQRSPMC
jgi:putative transposase